MSNASQFSPSADELAAAVSRVVDQRDELFTRLDDAEHALHLMRQERDELRRELDDMKTDLLVIRRMALPGGRQWTFVEDAHVLAISPDIDAATEARLRAQVEPPKLTTCATCSAPVYAGQPCGMHVDA